MLGSLILSLALVLYAIIERREPQRPIIPLYEPIASASSKPTPAVSHAGFYIPGRARDDSLESVTSGAWRDHGNGQSVSLRVPIHPSHDLERTFDEGLPEGATSADGSRLAVVSESFADAGSNMAAKDAIGVPPVCLVRVWSWPVSQCTLNGVPFCEAPSPQWFLVPSGTHVFVLLSPRIGETLTFQAQLDTGGHYQIKADLESRTYTVERLF